MNKEQIKELIFQNFTSDELYDLSIAFEKSERQRKLDALPSIEELFEQCKKTYQVGNYIRLNQQKYKEHSVDCDSYDDIFQHSSSSYEFEEHFLHITDLKLEDYSYTDDGEDFFERRVFLYFDFVSFRNDVGIDEEDYYLNKYVAPSTGNKKLLLVTDRNKRLNSFTFFPSNREEYESKLELVNKVFELLKY
jgi:hypothetical protein